MKLNRRIKVTIQHGNISYVSGVDFGITAGSMKFDEILCEKEFSLRQLCSSKFEMQCYNINATGTDNIAWDVDIAGWDITVECQNLQDTTNGQSIIVSTDTIFVGIIDSSSTDNFEDFRDIVAYDDIYTLRDRQVGTWWDTFWSSRPNYTSVSIPVGSPIVNNYYELDYVLSPDTEVDPNKTYYEPVYEETVGTASGTQYAHTVEDGVDIYIPIIDSTLPIDEPIYHIEWEEIINPEGDPFEENYYEYTYVPSTDTEVVSGKTYYYAVPIATIGEIRASLCNSVGLLSNTVTLVNDDIQVKQYLTSTNTNATRITFGELMSMICEINGVIGHIDRDGTFKFVSLGTITTQLDSYEKANVKFEDYETALITGINVYESDKNLMLSYAINTNAYNIVGNIFTLTLDDYSILNTMCSRILQKIDTIQYTPCKIPLVVSNINLQLGDKVSSNIGTHYIFSQSFSNSLLVDQTIECPAYGEVLSQEVSDLNNNIITNQKYSSIFQDQDEIRMELDSIESDMDSIQEQFTSISALAGEVNVSVKEIETVLFGDENDENDEGFIHEYQTNVNISTEGVRISQNVENAYTLFTDKGMSIYVDGVKTAWAEADGFSASELMISKQGENTKWHLHETNNGKTLMFVRR